ncbi:hypothetical protein EX30DRAFT_369095 [Ascodesmis nigricans]|uniref:Uncharacterized protein n=1 Tax=Ascodesmis nigricans TaxID=341454 RepID=A0A4S2N3K1_9PEZI|nr:hypothetical protein EX30DRAFT_369095 [Ascodesmis nigricans]
MHAPTLLTTLLVTLAASTAAWKMDVSYDDGTKLQFHGHHNSHCKKFKKQSAGITSVYFENSLSADTFELYADQRCKELVYKGGKGVNPVPNQIYGSYKVY